MTSSLGKSSVFEYKTEKQFLKTIGNTENCLELKPEKRPNCEEFLQRINGLTVDKTLLTEDNNILEELQTVLAEQDSRFLKMFFKYKINQI